MKFPGYPAAFDLGSRTRNVRPRGRNAPVQFRAHPASDAAERILVWIRCRIYGKTLSSDEVPSAPSSTSPSRPLGEAGDPPASSGCDSRLGAVVSRGPSLREACLGRTPPLPVRRRGRRRRRRPGTDRLSRAGRGPSRSLPSRRRRTSQVPRTPSVHDRMRALHPAPFRTPAAVVAPIAAAAEKTLPRGLRRRGRRGIPGDTLDVDAFGAPRHPRLRPPSRGGRPGDFAVRGDRRRVQPGPFAPGAAPAGRRRRRVAAVVPPGDAAYGGGGSAGGRGARGRGERLVILPCSQVITRDDCLSAACDGRADRPWSDLLRQGIRFHGADALLPRLYGHAAPVFSYLPRTPSSWRSTPWSASPPPGTPSRRRRKYALTGRRRGTPRRRSWSCRKPRAVAALSGVPMLAFDGSRFPLRAEGAAAGGRVGVDGNEEIAAAPATASSEGLLYPLAEEAKAWWKRGTGSSSAPSPRLQVDRMEDFTLPVCRAALPGRHAARGAVRTAGSSCAGRRSPGIPRAGARAAIVTEARSSGEKAGRAAPRKEGIAVPEEFSLADLRVNDPAVHVDHGIGIYRGAPAAHGRRDGRGTTSSSSTREATGCSSPWRRCPGCSGTWRRRRGARSCRAWGAAWQRQAEGAGRPARDGPGSRWTCRRSARLAEPAPVSPPDAVFRELRRRSPRGDAGPEQVIREVLSDLSSPSDGPARLRRRGVRQDRGGDPRGVPGGDGGGSRRRCWFRRPSSPSSIPDVHPPPRGVPPCGWRTCRGSAPGRTRRRW